jgi:Arc/MetJ-type ribon-helix-helix transcriptional regulator
VSEHDEEWVEIPEDSVGSGGKDAQIISIRVPREMVHAIVEFLGQQSNPGYTSTSHFIRDWALKGLRFWARTDQTPGEFQRAVGLLLAYTEAQAMRKEREHAEAVVDEFVQAFRAAERDQDAEEMARLVDRAKQACSLIRYRKLRERLEELVEKYR